MGIERFLIGMILSIGQDLIKFILSHVNSNELYKVSHVMSPTLIIGDVIQHGMNFEDYARYMAEMSKHVELTTQSITYDCGIYTAVLNLHIVDNSLQYYSNLIVNAAFVIKKNLVCEVNVCFVGSDEDLEYIHKVKNIYNQAIEDE